MLSKTMLHKTMLPFLPVLLTTFLGHIYHWSISLPHNLLHSAYFHTQLYSQTQDNSGTKKKKKKKGELFGGVNPL